MVPHSKYKNEVPPHSIANEKEDENGIHKGSELYREFQKRKRFEDKKNALHGKLRGVIEQKLVLLAKDEIPARTKENNTNK